MTVGRKQESERIRSIAMMLSKQTSSKLRRSYMTALKEIMSKLLIMGKQNVCLKIRTPYNQPRHLSLPLSKLVVRIYKLRMIQVVKFVSTMVRIQINVE
jgi:hypothetical protein